MFGALKALWIPCALTRVISGGGGGQKWSPEGAKGLDSLQHLFLILISMLSIWGNYDSPPHLSGALHGN